MSKKCTPCGAKAHFQVKMYKTHHSNTTFGSLRCRKIARRCGTKHISKSKCTKHTILIPLLEVETSKNCTPLWHEAHFQVKMYKTHHSHTTFGSWDVEKVHAVVARSTCPSQKCKRLRGFGPLFDLQMSKKCALLWREAYFQVKSAKCKRRRGFGPLLDIQMSKRWTLTNLTNTTNLTN